MLIMVGTISRSVIRYSAITRLSATVISADRPREWHGLREQLFVVQEIGRGPALPDVNDLSHVWRIRQHCRQYGNESVIHEKRGAAGIRQPEHDFRRREPRVDGDEHEPAERQAEQTLQVTIGVQRQYSNPLAWGEAMLMHGAGKPPDSLIERAPVATPFATYGRHLIRSGLDRPAHELRNLRHAYASLAASAHHIGNRIGNGPDRSREERVRGASRAFAIQSRHGRGQIRLRQGHAKHAVEYRAIVAFGLNPETVRAIIW